MILKTEHDKKAELWLNNLSLVPVKDQKAWIYESLRPKEMVYIFGRYFFPHFIKGLGTPDCHIDLLRELASPVDSAVIFPRGFAKSTWVKVDTLHDIVYGLEPVIVYVSDTLQDAGFHFESMRAELENNIGLRFVYGNLVPNVKGYESVKWTNTHFETTNDVNVVARGANKGRGVNIKNQRPTKIIVDDAESDEQVRSAMRRRKYHDWLYYVMIPSLDKERGRMKVIGTVIHRECEVLAFYNAKGGVYRRAIENGESIWPEGWPIAKLIRLRDGYVDETGKQINGIGTRAFNQEMQNDPSSYENSTIPADWIDENIYTILPSSKSRLNKVITIDPQSGETNEADEYAITLLAWYTGDSHRYVLEQEAGRGSQLHQAKKVIQMWLRHSETIGVGAEKVLNQTAVYQLLIDWRLKNLDIDGVVSEDRDIPVIAINPGGKDKVSRFNEQEPMIERGELHLRPEMNTLREQLLFIGSPDLEHDDRADSLLMAIKLSFNTVGNKQSNQSLSSKSATISGNLWREKF